MNTITPSINGPVKCLRKICRLGIAAAVSLFALNALAAAPTATSFSVVAAANRSAGILLRGSDLDGDRLTYRVTSAPSHGTLLGLSTQPQNLTYTPAANSLGSDSFTYTVSDGVFTSRPARVFITVKKSLEINNISLSEGNSGTKNATFTVTMTIPGSELDLVLVNYATSDGSARAGSDYRATSGTLIFAESTVKTISVPVIGDTISEFNESFLMNLFSASSNAVIVTPTGRCTIVDDEGLLTRTTVGTIAGTATVGTAELSPTDSVARVGEPVTLSLAWTHPVGWRKLDSINLILVDEEDPILNTIWHETPNAFSLLNSDGDKVLRIAEAGSQTRFETSAATLYLQESTGGGPAGKTVTIEYSLSFKPAAAGRTFSVEALAIDDKGNEQGYESVGTITVLPR